MNLEGMGIKGSRGARPADKGPPGRGRPAVRRPNGRSEPALF